MKRKNTSKRVLRRAKTGAQAALAQKKADARASFLLFWKGFVNVYGANPKIYIEKRKEKAI